MRALAACAAPAPKLTVHLVPHTHDDVGWIKIVDGYYSGTNSSLQHAAVRNVLSSVVLSLGKKPERKFTYVEQAFFQRWWREQDEVTRAATRKLVADGQLSFANGGWCMPDEGATHYADLFANAQKGLRWIAAEFGAEARPPSAGPLTRSATPRRTPR